MGMRASQWPELLLPGINHFFVVGMDRVPAMREQLYNVQETTLTTQYGVGVGGMSSDTWNKYSQSGKAIKGELKNDQLYKTGYTQVEYPATLTIEKALLRGDQYGEINKTIARAGRSAAVQMEEKAASLLNNAFSANFLQGDGVALCASTHPKSPTDTSTGNLVNSGVLPLDKDNLGATRIAMRAFVDDVGSKIGAMPNEIWYPDALSDVVDEIILSPLDPDSGNNAINPQDAGRWVKRPWLRLDSDIAWFIVDGVLRQDLVNWYNRVLVTDDIMVTSESLTHITYEFLMEYSFGSDDWRWIYGQTGVGS